MKHPIARKFLTILLCFGGAVNLGSAADFPGTSPGGVRFFKDSPVPQAVVLSVSGPCQGSKAGDKFSRLKVGQVLREGAVIRTGAAAHVDLFLQRMAITVRLTSNTDLGLQKMAKYMKDEVLVTATILDLRAGQIFCFVRGLVPNSRFEVKHAAGLAVVEGEGVGAYEIRADSAAVKPGISFIPLKIISESGVSIVAPGQRFDAKRGETLELAPTEVEDTLMQLDELEALADLLSPQEELPGKSRTKSRHESPE
jgi:hypothetical protein